MKIVVIGASGYLGSELFHQADAVGHEITGTYYTHPAPGLMRFEIEDKNSWATVINENPDVIIWAAWSEGAKKQHEPFAAFLSNTKRAKFIYISSDITQCKRALAAENTLGDYARRKQNEQAVALASPASAVFVTGPIYGKNTKGALDKRSLPLINEPGKRREYWSNVYKTFVPVKGLARTILANLDKSGLYFAGPHKRSSYFGFYKSRVRALGIPADNFQPVKVTGKELEALNQCPDLSYANNPKRLWYKA